VTVYAGVLALGALSYTFLVRSLSKLHGEYSTFTKAVNRDRVKGYFTLGVDVLAALIAYIGFPKIAFTFIALTALLWFLPSRIISGNK
ncbi:MAG: hypothetical protein ACXWCZ_11520, partial [Flavisolibacter sp.]